ncbi:hypothetical protein FJT64_020582 [Amphibalanus amphitrite]|uniref:Uncharacterized protein n=1 Tax=Amphibalanus amphitrite TaxID=1232801 RepID=A0A6A4WL77_AMPAM|nr:hypothetical protein FJT64_020582 [Amphibalanus amphitrite]
MSAAMAALFRRKKHLDVSGAPQKKGRSQSLDPTSLAYLSLKQAGGSSDKKGQTIDRLTVPEVTETPPTNNSRSSSPSHGHSPNRRASDLFEGGLRQFQQLYKRRGSREPPETEESSSKTLQVPKPRQRSGSVDVGRLTVSSGRRGSTEGSRSLPQQGRRGSVDPGLRLYTALRPNVNGVRRGSVDANVKQFQAVYQQRKALKSEQAALYAAGSGSTSPVPVSIPESPEITSRYHKPKPGSAAAAAAEAAAAELDAAQREMVRLDGRCAVRAAQPSGRINPGSGRRTGSDNNDTRELANSRPPGKLADSDELLSVLRQPSKATAG